MIVGSLRVRFLIRESRSLKDKRQVIRSITDRLRNNFNVSVAEVEAQDHRQLAVLGIAMVGNEAGAGDITFVEDDKHSAQLSQTRASAAVVPMSFTTGTLALIQVADPLGQNDEGSRTGALPGWRMGAGAGWRSRASSGGVTRRRWRWT